LVLELPITASLSSAEGFAREGVRILSGFCQRLCFGAETADKDILLATAGALLRADFPEALHQELYKGLSFPAARQAALEAMGLDANTLSKPNDILATEYCKAILELGSAMEPMVIAREGGYHDVEADRENPSATAVRERMLSNRPWEDFVPTDAFAGVSFHCLQAGEQAILYRLQTMTDEEFEALPYGSEGLWRKLMHNARTFSTLEDILTATKSKRYARTRLDRMAMCAFLGLAERDLASPAPYVRVLALNDKGREILKAARLTGSFPNAGERVDHPYQELEYRAGMADGLFTQGQVSLSREEDRRIYYKKETEI
jgi:predicted nucleotidyltransferase